MAIVGESGRVEVRLRWEEARGRNATTQGTVR